MGILISENLKFYRNKKGNTQDELADILGISKQSVSKWERGEGYPDITLLPHIASYYNVTTDELLGTGEIQKKQDNKIQVITNMINDLCGVLFDMSKVKTGALVVIENTTKLGDVIKSGTIIDARMSPLLLKNIFFKKAPLHDGAVIVRESRIYAAGCFLPLSVNIDIIKDLGTRHRAAIGISENSDAIILVVSEETGIVSMAHDGKLQRNYDYMSLKHELVCKMINDVN